MLFPHIVTVISSFNKCLLNIVFVSGIVVCSGDLIVNKVDIIFFFLSEAMKESTSE